MPIKQSFDKPVWDDLQKRYVEYMQLHPNMTQTERLILLNRTLEKAHYGVTMRDLARGYEIDYVQDSNSKKWMEVTSAVDGVIKVGGTGNDTPNSDPTVAFHRTSWKVTNGKPMSYMELVQDKKIKREINLAASEHTTASDIAAAGTALLEHEGIDTGFGATPGVITPRFVDMMMKKFSETTVFKNFVTMFPMPGMTFYYPIKTTVPTDDAGTAFDVAPTPEGQAGLEYAMSFTKYLINGWKHLRHAGLTDELLDLLSGFIPVQAEYVEDLGEVMAFLWDYAIAEGMFNMLYTAKWWRPGTAGTVWAAEEFVPLAGAAGVNILAGNAKKHFLWQDISGVAADDGKIFEPHGTTTDEYETGVLRGGSSTTDTPFELVLALATLLKDKKSKCEYVAWPTKITELISRDARFLEMIQATGSIQFQSENGYLGQIAIGGTNGRTDVWEYDSSLLDTKLTGDVGTWPMLPIFAGKYGRAWNLGMYTPLYMRVDDGREVVAAIGTGDSNVTRVNETRVITAGTKGSSFPGNFNDLVMGLAMVDKYTQA
jgi:hypothetical protein